VIVIFFSLISILVRKGTVANPICEGCELSMSLLVNENEHSNQGSLQQKSNRIFDRDRTETGMNAHQLFSWWYCTL